jgi:hypothetical protein
MEGHDHQTGEGTHTIEHRYAVFGLAILQLM